MRKALFILALLAITGPALASWKVGSDGTALVENGGDSSISLRCDKNVNTNNQQVWRLELASTSLTGLGPQAELDFRFPGAAPMKMTGDYRLGKISLEGMNMANQSKMTALINQIKKASRVTVTITDNTNGSMVGAPLKFNLAGSSRAVNKVANSCH